MNLLLRSTRALAIGFALFLISLAGVDLTTAYLTDSAPGETSKYVIQRTGEFLEKKFVLGITKSTLQNSIPQVLPQVENIPPEKAITLPDATTTAIAKPVVKEKPEVITKKKLSLTESAQLTTSGILIITNQERAMDGKGTLIWNEKLAAAALKKAHDLEDRQYFAHVSPDGKGPQDLAKEQNYNYMLVGENLALGDFYSDRDVMDGWMHSPGHRANILKPGYTEMGVAAFLGKYNGRPAWFAVQEFGRPEPICPKPDDVEKAWIEKEHDSVHTIAMELDKKRTEIDTFSGDPAEKAQLVTNFNALVASHNQLLDTLKQRIAAFNSTVTIYNACIAHARELAGITATDTVETTGAHE